MNVLYMDIWSCELFIHYVIVCRFYLGTVPWLVVSDLDMLKQILVKEFDSFADRPVSVCACSKQ